MPLIKAPYPPLPVLPPLLNFHTMLVDMPPGSQVPRDQVLHIDGMTGEERTYGGFVERVRDGATALAASVQDGGLGLSFDAPVPKGELHPTAVDRGALESTRRAPTEIVAIFAPNCLDYIVLVHTCLVLTVPFVLLPSKPTQSELEYLLGKAKATRLFVHPNLFSQAAKAATKVGLAVNKIYLLDGRDKSKERPDFGSLIENVKRRSLPRQGVVPANKDALAYLIFSSGTGGPPKAVMISHGNLCCSVLQSFVAMQETLKVIPAPPAAPPRTLCFLPFYHSFGLHFFMFRPMLRQNTLIILPRWNIDEALAAIPKYKISFLALVPSIIHQLVHSPQTAKTDLSSIVSAGSGAAYLPTALNKRMQEIFKTESEVIEGYGLSEATIGSMFRPQPGVLGMQPVEGSTGILLAGQEARIVREDGTDADYGEPGELWLRGGNVALGYWNDKEATREAFLPGGWLRTGDRFRVDETGTFYYHDRLKDTLKISGAQVSPVELENTLLAHPEQLITDVAVAGVPGGRTDDERVPRAWIVLSAAGRKLGEREVKTRLDAWSRKELSRYKWLTGGIEVVKEIPKNPTGKVLRRVLVENYLKNGKTKAKL